MLADGSPDLDCDLFVEITYLSIAEERNKLALKALEFTALQFVPLEHRQRVVHNIFTHTRPGGAFVRVEKVLGASSGINATMVETYEAMKARNGYTSEQIDRKRASLEGALVPLTVAWNEDLLRQAGFRYIDCFWRWMNFAGWIAVRPD